MLEPYRRHLKSCPHRHKGVAYTLCQCPIWAYGTLKGRPFRQSLRTTSGPHAHQIIELLEAGRDPTYPNAAGLGARTVSVAAAEYLNASHVRESTMDVYRKTLAALDGAVPLDLAGIDYLYAHRAGRRISAASWRKELQILRGFFAWCVTRKWIAENPAKAIKMPPAEQLKTQPFTADEVTRLLAACDTIAAESPNETAYIRRRARALVLVLLYSGLRVSDVGKLQRSALEPTGHLVLKVLKTGVRLKVQLHADAVAALGAMPAVSTEYFFWSGRGTLGTCTRNIRRTIQRIGDIAGIHAHPHRFRDTFAVELLTAGADIRTVQKLLGHASVRTTENHYSHFVAAHQALLDSATARLDFNPPAARPLLMNPRKDRLRNA